MKLKERLASSLRHSRSRRPELRLPRGWPQTEGPLRWHTPGGGTENDGFAGSLDQLSDQLRAGPIHVWTPAAETLLTRVNLPTRSRARILQALPYALEEQLLDEPEQLHFAYVREPDGNLAVAVTKRQRLTEWLGALNAAGVTVGSMCPAHLALPLQSNVWSLAFIDDELWVRTGAFSGFTMLATVEPPPLLVAAVREAQAENRAPQELIVFRPPGMLDIESWSAALGISVLTDSSDVWDMTSVPAITLLQAEFSSGGHFAQIGRPLRPAAILLAIWLMGMFIVDVIEWVRLRQLHKSYQAEMHEIYRVAFGGPALKPYEQMQKSIETLQARGGSPGDMLPLLSRLAPSLQTQQAIRLQGIKYDQRNLTVDLVLPDYQALDLLKNSLQSANLEVEVLGANGRAGSVEGRLRIKQGIRPGRAS